MSDPGECAPHKHYCYTCDCTYHCDDPRCAGVYEEECGVCCEAYCAEDEEDDEYYDEP